MIDDEDKPQPISLESLPSQELEQALEESVPRLTGWRSKLIWREDSHGRATSLRDHVVNVTEILANDERWAGCLSLNEFSQIVELTKNPPHEDALRSPIEEGAATFLSRPVTDADMTFVSGWLAHQYSLFVTPNVVGQGVHAVASRNGHHPVRSYLESLAWDGTERLSHWLEDFMGATSTTGHTNYVRQVGRAWMISAVARIYRPGCKADHVLVLEGMTGIKKSTVFAVLGSPWFTDQLGDLGSKDSSLNVQGKWIIELAELDVMSRHEVGRVKAFLTIQSDWFRPPYGHVTMRYDRQCVFAGTVNHTDYLRDETGNRRFWPVRCADDRIDIDALIEARDQLWAEAVMAYKAGEKWWLEDESAAREEQEDRMQIDAWEEPVCEYLAQAKRDASVLQRERTHVTVSGVLKALQVSVERQGRPEQVRVVSILKRLGWERKKVRTEYGGFEWRYLPPNT